jgi:hypothetical protein
MGKNYYLCCNDCKKEVFLFRNRMLPYDHERLNTKAIANFLSEHHDYHEFHDMIISDNGRGYEEIFEETEDERIENERQLQEFEDEIKNMHRRSEEALAAWKIKEENDFIKNKGFRYSIYLDNIDYRDGKPDSFYFIISWSDKSFFDSPFDPRDVYDSRKDYSLFTFQTEEEAEIAAQNHMQKLIDEKA